MKFLKKLFSVSEAPFVYKISNFLDVSSIRSVMFDVGDDLIVNEMKKGDWEKGSIRIWMQLINNFDFDQIWDIGAYTGIFGLLALEFKKIKTRVLFIEANPFVFSRLVANVRLNGYVVKNLKWAAVSESKGKDVDLSLRLSPSALTTAGCVATKSLVNDTRYDVSVPNMNLMDFTKLLRGTILLKIDVEGAEYPLLKGVLEKYREATCVILVEILTETIFRETIGFLADLECSLYPIDETSATLGNLFSYNPSESSRNYIIATKKSAAIINRLKVIGH
jgi:FkbM family methyltransferase